MSLPDVTRHMANAWKADLTIARLVLSADLAHVLQDGGDAPPIGDVEELLRPVEEYEAEPYLSEDPDPAR